jgi:hypothetical protein
MPEPDAIRCLLRALANAQVTHFLPLLYKVRERKTRSTAQLNLNILRSDRGKDAAYLVLYVDVTREDSTVVTWSVRLDALPDRVDVSGGVELHDDDGSREVFGRSESAATAIQAAEAIARIAPAVCEQVSYVEPSS